MKMTTMMPMLLAAALAGCASAEAAPSPRDVRPGLDACEYCHMRVDDARMAAQFVEANGRVRMFDEPGCMAAWMKDHADAAGAPFVADAAGGGWIAAEDAHWVRGAAGTPMGFGLAAFRDRADAEARAAARGGTVAPWETILAEGVEHGHAH